MTSPLITRTSTWLTVPCLTLAALCSVAASKRALEINDFDRLLAVKDPVCSQDGRWIAYIVEGADPDADERKSALWMVNFEGTEHLRLSAAEPSVSAPRFSPDGRYVSFLSSRGTDARAQIYLLDRRGGEAQAITDASGDIGSYDWSPDATRLVLSMSPGEDASGSAKTPKPIVIDRLHFKEDKEGYLTAASRPQLYVLDVAGKKLARLTTDARFEDSSPIWSPDGKTIAFFSNRTTDPDRSGMQELYLIEPRIGAVPRKLAEFYAPNKPALLFTRDGKQVVYTSGLEPKLNAYIQDRLTIASVSEGRAQVLAESIDRAFSSPAATEAGTIGAILEDDRSDVPVSVRLETGSIERRLPGNLSVTGLCSGGGRTALVASTDGSAPEIHALEGSDLRKLSAHNDALMEELSLGAVEDIAFPSRDGTMIHGMMVKPVGYRPGRTYPAIVWIHGGPNGQDSHGLDFGTYAPALERQWFAAHGYVVLAINYRGSSGRGAEFARAIAADWGNKEVADLLAGVDYLVRGRIADPKRLGIGGWSYGAILTDYTIARDGRFKAAISGAGSGNQLSMYGTDEYLLQYNAEIGFPWRTRDLWLRLSYPFFHSDRIKTPTLFLGGDKDFNVPVAGGEQMYAALRTRGVPTQLIVYPGQFHELTHPSYIKDRAARFLAWFDRYLAPEPAPAPKSAAPAPAVPGPSLH